MHYYCRSDLDDLDLSDMKRSLGVRCMQTLPLLHGTQSDLPTMPEDMRDWQLSPVPRYKPTEEPRCKCGRIECNPG